MIKTASYKGAVFCMLLDDSEVSYYLYRVGSVDSLAV